MGEIAALFSYDTVVYDPRREREELVLQLLELFCRVFNYSPVEMRSIFLRSSLDEIRALVENEPDVYILITASPTGAMLSGKPEAIERILNRGSFVSFPMANSLSIHTPIVEHFYQPVYEATLKCGNKIRPDLDFEIYSATLHKRLTDTVEALAEYSAAILTKPCDFYGLLEMLYAKGARVFVDMGTGGVCQTWAGFTFADRDALCMSVYPPIFDAWGAQFRNFAKLLANHVHLDADVLLNSFTHPFLQNTQAAQVEPAAQDLKPAHMAGTVSAARPATAPGLSEYARQWLHGYMHRGFHNNLRAYLLYLESEALPFGHPGNAAGRRVLWNRQQLLEITAGKPSKVWGRRYEALDTLKKRARLPMPPFMFVSRVMGIDAEFGNLRKSHIDYEIDITRDNIMTLSENTISYLLLTESAHVSVLLLSYIGIDMIYGKEISYRILNTSVTIHDGVPIVGDTVRLRLELVEFLQIGSTSLIKLRNTCYKKGRLVADMELMGGFFTEGDLEDPKGILPDKKAVPAPLPKGRPLRINPRAELVLDPADFYEGRFNTWMYPERTSAHGDRPNVHPLIRMLDRIITLDFTGGDYGLGIIIAEKDIDAGHWSFGVHFLNDPVFPGSLLVEAADQIQLLFALNAGCFQDEGKYYLSCKHGLPVTSLFRGEIKPAASTIRFVQHIKDITEIDGRILIISDSDAYWQGKHVARTMNISLSIENIVR